MIHRHKNLHFSALNLSAPTLHINRNQANTQLEGLGKSRGDADTRCASQLTSVIGEVL